MGSVGPLISVVVPTRNRPAALRVCLAALDAQTAADRLEVLVVDDGSDAADEVAAVVASHHCSRLVPQEGKGPAAARNAAARVARGTILCFTDDDCVPEPDWVEQLAAAVERGADAVAGVTLSAGGALADASEIVAHAPAGAQPAVGHDILFAPSNNLACTRTAFAAVQFDESYPNAAGEDREWCARMAAAGYTLRYESGARVEHRQELSLRSFLSRQVRYGEAAYRFRRRNAQGALEPVGFYYSLVLRAFSHGLVVGVLVSIAQVATAFGFTRAWLTAPRGAL